MTVGYLELFELKVTGHSRVDKYTSNIKLKSARGDLWELRCSDNRPFLQRLELRRRNDRKIDIKKGNLFTKPSGNVCYNHAIRDFEMYVKTGRGLYDHERPIIVLKKMFYILDKWSNYTLGS